MQSGSKVCNLSVATSERWKKDGQQQERTEWHRICIFDDRLCDVAEKYLTKGAKVCIEGELQTRKWQDQSGQDKYSTEVVLRKFRGQLTMLDSKGASEPGAQEPTDDLDSEVPF
jgi:single-strand DNA-binding protein